MLEYIFHDVIWGETFKPRESLGVAEWAFPFGELLKKSTLNAFSNIKDLLLISACTWSEICYLWLH